MSISSGLGSSGLDSSSGFGCSDFEDIFGFFFMQGIGASVYFINQMSPPVKVVPDREIAA